MTPLAVAPAAFAKTKAAILQLHSGKSLFLISFSVMFIKPISQSFWLHVLLFRPSSVEGILCLGQSSGVEVGQGVRTMNATGFYAFS